jgi:hypothetical protein
LPSCVLAPTLFYRKVEPGILAKVRESKTAMAMNRMFAPPTVPPSYPPSMPAPPDRPRPPPSMVS